MIIRVPASSANLGPGFDCFGLAWKLYNEVEFEQEEKLIVEGCDKRFAGENNLVWCAYTKTLENCGRRAKGLHINFRRMDIPISRGLGSSAALIAAGVLAANELNSLSLDRSELLDLAAAMEGHPDNAAPVLLGGLTAALWDGQHVAVRRFSVSDEIRFTLLVPPFELSTALARQVMPEKVEIRDAVFNLSRSVMLLRAFSEGDGELLRLSLDDRLHQPFRARLIPGYETAKDIANKLGMLGLCISGAGSTLLCVSKGESMKSAMQKSIQKELPGWQVIDAIPDACGACVM